MAEPLQSGGQRARRKHHHHFPRFHLREFEAGRDRVWQYDRLFETTENPCLVLTTRAGSLRDLYAPEVGAEPKSDELETWFDQQSDGPAAPAFRRLLSGAVLDGSERSDLARYVMAMDLRSPKAHDFLMGVTQESLERDWAALHADPEKLRSMIREQSGVEITDEVIEYARSKYRPQVAKPFWFHFMIRQINPGARRLFAYRWLVVQAPPGLEYLTSDIGIVKHIGDFTNPATHMIGWWNGAPGWVMPLSPTKALALSPDGEREQGAADATPAFLEQFNRTMVAQAHRFVYSRGHHQFIIEWLREQESS